MNTSRSPQAIIEQLATWLTLAVLLLYTYGNFFVLPYTGFYFIESSGRVVTVYQPGGVQPDDELVQVGDVTLADFQLDRARLPLQDLPAGSVVDLVLRRDGQTVEVPWTMPGFTWREFFDMRLNNQWTLPFAFWAIGSVALLGLRPRRPLQRLLAAFAFLTALWLSASVVSRWHLWLSQPVLRSTLWLSVPVYWHLHWNFPEPLRRLPRWVGWLLYGVFGATALAEWARALPLTLYALALLLAPIGSLVLVAAHLVWQPRTRRAALTLVGGAVLSLVPTIVLGISASVLTIREAALAGLLALPILPIAYLVAIYRHRFGGLELRVNRAISIYLFLLVVLTIFVLAAGIVEGMVPGDHGGLIVATVVVIGLAGVLGAIFGFAPFQRLVEHYFLGVPPAPTHLVVKYASQIGTRLSHDSLARLLRDEVLKSLLVRQSALLAHNGQGGWRVLYADGVPEDKLADPAAGEALLAGAGRYLPPGENGAHGEAWVRLALPLQADGRPLGLWLLGRRDPDDFYAASEITVLRALADQTAVALLNIEQAEHLQALYRANVDRAEKEGISLARELHDGPLNEFGRLAHKIEGGHITPDFQATFTEAVNGLRRVIAGLRPAMLNYGLHAGLQGLVTGLEDQWPDGPEVLLDVPPSGCRYPEHVEAHAFRIVQQACANAVRHAQARSIRITGHIAAERLDLTVEDDGRGFDAGADLGDWLARGHFGLAGMHERAALIGGHVQVASARGAGTRVRLVWEASELAVQTQTVL